MPNMTKARDAGNFLSKAIRGVAKALETQSGRSIARTRTSRTANLVAAPRPLGIRSLNIAILHLGFFYSGGGEKLVLEEIKGITNLGHNVTCFAPFVDSRNCFPDYGEIKDVQAFLPKPPDWLPMKDPLWVLLSCMLAPLIAWRFRAFDVLFGANQPSAWIAYVAAKMLRKPYVIYLAQPLRILHPRGVDLENGIRIREGDHRFLVALHRFAGNLIDRLDRKSVSGAQAVLSNGEHVRKWIDEIYGVKSRLCSAGSYPIAANELTYGDRWAGEYKLGGRKIHRPYILLTNRHSPMKRFEYALWAMKTILRDQPQVQLVITGQETVYTDMLRHLSRTLCIEDSIVFVGLVPESGLRKLYVNAAAYVYPSPEEDFGMGIVEAMAAGTPVVAWDNCGPTATVQNGQTGFLVRPYDTLEFAECLAVLVGNPEMAERMGRAGNRRANELFSYSRHNETLEQVLLDALSDFETSHQMGAKEKLELVEIPLASNQYQHGHASTVSNGGLSQAPRHTGATMPSVSTTREDLK